MSTILLFMLVSGLFIAFFKIITMNKQIISLQNEKSKLNSATVVKEKVKSENELDVLEYHIHPKNYSIENESEEVIIKLMRHIENSYDKDVMNEIKNRIISKRLIHASEYDMYEYEFKKFLVLTQFMDGVPMYSHKTDAIWHEFLMFTKSYESFCNKFNGSLIHHEPNFVRSNGERSTPNQFKSLTKDSLFTFLYLNMFSRSPQEELINKQLKDYLYSETFLNEFVQHDTDVLMEEYFKINQSNIYASEMELLLKDKIKEFKDRLSYLLEKNSDGIRYSLNSRNHLEMSNNDNTFLNTNTLILLASINLAYDAGPTTVDGLEKEFDSKDDDFNHSSTSNSTSYTGYTSSTSSKDDNDSSGGGSSSGGSSGGSSCSSCSSSSCSSCSSCSS